MSISATRIEGLLLPLPLPRPIQTCSALSLILGRICLWQSWGPTSDTLRRLFFYCWERWDFPHERGWDEWVSTVFIETRCNISQGINRTMECWQKGWFFCNCGNPAVFPGTILIVYLHLNFNKQGSCCVFMNFQMEIYFPLLSPSCESGPILQICSWVHRRNISSN